MILRMINKLISINQYFGISNSQEHYCSGVVTKRNVNNIPVVSSNGVVDKTRKNLAYFHIVIDIVNLRSFTMTNLVSVMRTRPVYYGNSNKPIDFHDKNRCVTQAFAPRC